MLLAERVVYTKTQVRDEREYGMVKSLEHWETTNGFFFFFIFYFGKI